MIRNATIETLTIAGNAVTVNVAATNASSITVDSVGVTVSEATVDFGDVAPEIAIATACIYQNSGLSPSYTLAFYRDSTLINSKSVRVFNPDGLNVTIQFVDEYPTTGESTYKIIGKTGTSTATLSEVSMVIQGAKR